MSATKETTVSTEIEGTTPNDDARYPIWDIKENRAEIRKIAQTCQQVASEYNNELSVVSDWTAFPRVAIEMLIALLEEVHRRSITEKANVSFNVGNLVKITIEYMETVNADKFGSLNPRFDLLDELSLDYDVPVEIADTMTADMRRELNDENVHFLLPQFYDDRKTFKAICEKLIPVLKEKYRIVMYDWSLPLYIFTIFMRTTLQYLKDHKLDGEFGIEINLADVAYFGIEPFGDPENPSYQAFMNPGQIFKKDNSKDDKGTEEE